MQPSNVTMAGSVTQEMEFMTDVEERRPGFLKQVKAFFKETDGGAVPISVAKAVLGYSQATIYRLIEKEREEPGTGLRAWKFNKTLLICAKDIDRIADAPRPKMGRPRKSDG